MKIIRAKINEMITESRKNLKTNKNENRLLIRLMKVKYKQKAEHKISK
jgi:hypothetical protein